MLAQPCSIKQGNRYCMIWPLRIFKLLTRSFFLFWSNLLGKTQSLSLLLNERCKKLVEKLDALFALTKAMEDICRQKKFFWCFYLQLGQWLLDH